MTKRCNSPRKKPIQQLTDIYENKGCVCPAILIDKLFITGNLDNVDHNPSSTSSIMALQYPSHNMSQMINGVVRVVPVIPYDKETTEGRASN